MSPVFLSFHTDIKVKNAIILTWVFLVTILSLSPAKPQNGELGSRNSQNFILMDRESWFSGLFGFMRFPKRMKPILLKPFFHFSVEHVRLFLCVS